MNRTRPLAMTPDAFRDAGHLLVDLIADHLATLPERPVTGDTSPQAIRSLLDAEAGLPATGEDPVALLRTTAETLFSHSLFNGHPRFFGYITSSPSHIGILADLLAAAVNPNVGAWTLAPVATEIESQTVRWIAELLHYPIGCGGLLVSGGNMANLVAFVAARAAMVPGNVRQDGVGNDSGRRLRVYASAETHTWIQKAADITGLGTDAIVWISTDRDLRMDSGELRRRLEAGKSAGHLPIVIGTAGSVSTGAVDPLVDIAAACREFGAWFHVDGAYGAFAAALPDRHPDLAGMAEADSIAVDPHKWLYAPLEAGCTLVRDAEKLRQAFAYHPPYYHFGVEATNYLDLGPQNSRGFRALKVWMSLRSVGREGYVRMIGDDVALARRLADRVREEPELEMLTQSLSITTFRYAPRRMRGPAAPADAKAYLNKLNQRLLDRIQRSGEAFVSNAVVFGQYALRACIVNFNTTAADVDRLPGIVTRIGRQCDEELAAEFSRRS